MDMNYYSSPSFINIYFYELHLKPKIAHLGDAISKCSYIIFIDGSTFFISKLMTRLLIFHQNLPFEYSLLNSTTLKMEKS